jgi:hypothetical protein
MSRLFHRDATLGVQVCHPLIAPIGNPQWLKLSRQFGVLQDAKIVVSSWVKGGADDSPRQRVHHHWRFQRVPPLLATVERSLFFSRAAKFAGVISAPVEPSKSEESDEIGAAAPVCADAVAV